MIKTDYMVLEELKEKCIGNMYEDMYDIIIEMNKKGVITDIWI